MKSKKSKTILDAHNQAVNAGKGLKVPIDVWTKIHASPIEVECWGDQIVLTHINGGSPDFSSLEELRYAFQWYVEQLGGKVTWPGESGEVSKSSTVRGNLKD